MLNFLRLPCPDTLPQHSLRTCETISSYSTRLPRGGHPSHVSAASKIPKPTMLNSGCAENDVRRSDYISSEAPLRVIIAGGGLGGLFAAISLRKIGADVTVLERTSKFRPLGGPIQLASNGVSAIKATSEILFNRVHEVGRPFWRTTSGIRDGISGRWMFEFGAITEIPVERNLPFSICVDRSDLQDVLLEEFRSEGTLLFDSSFARYRNNSIAQGGGVTVFLDDGRELQADVLVGADGIWSQVRAQMFGEPVGAKGASSTASFTGFKLYSGLPILKAYYYEDVGYSVG